MGTCFKRWDRIENMKAWRGLWLSTIGVQKGAYGLDGL